MATTARDFSKVQIGTRIIQITLSSTTGATANIVNKAPSMFAPELTYETVGAQNAHAEMGNPLMAKLGLKWSLTGIGETLDWTAINEICSENIAYVNIKFITGQNITFNSGADDESIMYFNYTMPESETARVVEIAGIRDIPYSAITIS